MTCDGLHSSMTETMNLNTLGSALVAVSYAVGQSPTHLVSVAGLAVMQQYITRGDDENAKAVASS